MAHWLVCDGEFAQIVPNHLRLDIYGDEFFAVVHFDLYANHLGKDYQIPNVRLDVHAWIALLRFTSRTHLLQQNPLLRRQTPLQAASLP